MCHSGCYTMYTVVSLLISSVDCKPAWIALLIGMQPDWNLEVYINGVNKPGRVTSDKAHASNLRVFSLKKHFLELELGGGLTLNQLLFC